MTTLDGVERDARRRDRAGLRPRTADRDRRGHGRPGLRGLRRDDPGPARGGELERDQHPPHLAPARAALGGLLAVREAAPPGADACGRSGSPRGCWSSSAGRSWCRGRSTSPRRAPAPRTLRAARRAGRGPARDGDLPGRPDRLPRAARLRRSRPTARTSRSTVPPDRYYDVTREIDLIEEVGAGPRPRRAPADDAARGRRAGRRAEPRAAAAAAGRGRPARPRLRPGRRLELHRPGRGRRGCGSRADDPRADPVLRRQPALRGAVGDADDAARLAARRRRAQRSPAAPSGWRCSRPAASTCDAAAAEPRAAPLAGDFPGERPAPVTEPLRIAALAVGAARRRAPGAAAASRPTSSRSRASLEALAGQLGAELELRARPRSRSCIPAAPPRSSVGGAAAGWIGELHPLVCRAWDLDAAVAFEIDAAPLLAAAGAGEEAYEDVTTFPAALRTWRSSSPAEGPRPTVRAAVLAAGGELLRAAEVFDLYEGEQLGEGRKSLALRARVPGRRPDPDRRGGRRRARRDRGRAGRRSGGRCVSELDTATARRRARGAGPGRRRQRLHRRPGGEDRLGPPAAASWSRRPRASDAGKRIDQLYPRYRVPVELTELDLETPSSTGSTPRSSPTRTAPPRRPSRRCAPPGSSSSTSPPTSGCATWTPTSAGTASTARPTCSAPASTG